MTASVISERIVGEVFVAKDVIFARSSRIRSAWVDEHGGVHVVPDSLLEELESLLELGRGFADTEQGKQLLSEGVNVIVIVLLATSVFVHGDFLFSSEQASNVSVVYYLYILVIFCVEVRVCGNWVS